MLRIRLKSDKGVTLVETIFYLAVLVVITLVVARAIISLVVAYHEIQVNADLASTSVILDKLSQEIRYGYNINNLSPTSLVIDSRDDLGNARTVAFTLSGNDLRYYINNTYVGNLNSVNLSVTSLTFSPLTSVHSQAVRINLSVRSKRYGSTRIENFYNTVVLRGATCVYDFCYYI